MAIVKDYDPADQAAMKKDFGDLIEDLKDLRNFFVAQLHNSDAEWKTDADSYKLGYADKMKGNGDYNKHHYAYTAQIEGEDKKTREIMYGYPWQLGKVDKYEHNREKWEYKTDEAKRDKNGKLDYEKFPKHVGLNEIIHHFDFTPVSVSFNYAITSAVDGYEATSVFSNYDALTPKIYAQNHIAGTKIAFPEKETTLTMAPGYSFLGWRNTTDTNDKRVYTPCLEKDSPYILPENPAKEFKLTFNAVVAPTIFTVLYSIESANAEAAGIHIRKYPAPVYGMRVNKQLNLPRSYDASYGVAIDNVDKGYSVAGWGIAKDTDPKDVLQDGAQVSFSNAYVANIVQVEDPAGYKYEGNDKVVIPKGNYYVMLYLILKSNGDASDSSASSGTTTSAPAREESVAGIDTIVDEPKEIKVNESLTSEDIISENDFNDSEDF